MKKYYRMFNTIKHLKLTQIFFRLKYIVKNKKRNYLFKLEYKNHQLLIDDLHLNKKYLERFDIDLLMDNKVKILNKIILLDYSPNYLSSLLPLYQFNVQYFEYAILLGMKYKETNQKKYVNLFEKIYLSYFHNNIKPSAYVYSLQIINIFICLNLFGDSLDKHFKIELINELYSQYRFVISHQEKHLLANHYFENLKTIVIASYFFSEYKICNKYIKKLKNEINKEILPDGVHFELSFMYHKIILEDLILIAKLAKNNDFPKCEWILPIIQKMLNAISSIEKGIGRTPLFNDAGDNVAKSVDILAKTCKTEFNIEPLLTDSFVISGYYKLYDGNICLLFDAGKIGLDYNPGHGHCDCLSFELSINNIPLFVNSGTYQYQDNKRNYFRSTQSHNTLMINDIEQSQIWGEHRVARRIKKVKCYKNGNLLHGQFNNYCGDKFMRSIELINTKLKVIDSINSNKNSLVHSYLRISNLFNVDNGCILFKNKIIASICPINCDYIIKSDEDYSPEFGLIKKVKCLEFTWSIDKEEHGYIIDFRKEDLYND